MIRVEDEIEEKNNYAHSTTVYINPDPKNRTQ